MPDILIRGIGIPSKSDLVVHIYPDGKAVFYPFHGKPRKVKVLELPPHGDLIEIKDVLLALVEHGQRDKRFKLGDTIRYSPSEVKEIIDASVPVVVPAERSDTDA